MLAIKNNLMSANAARHLGTAYDALAQSVERLASGLRINSAKDDAAGLAVRELIRGEVAVLQQGARNALDGISMLQTMEGALAVVDENLIRMKELAEQAATGSYSDAQREIMNSEFAEMAAEIERIAGSAAFNGITMLNTSTGDVKIHVGTASTIDVDKVDMTQEGLNIETGDGQWAIMTMDDATSAYDAITSTALTFDTGTYDFEIKFGTGTVGDEEVIDVDLAIGTYTLEQLKDAINTESMNPAAKYDCDGNPLFYQAASIVETDDTKFKLKLTARDGEAQQVTIAIVAGSSAANVDGIFGTQASVGSLLDDSLFQKQDTNGNWVNDTGGGASAGLNILTVDAAITALATVTTAINTKVEARAAFGYKMNRLESTLSVLDVQTENLMAAESRVSDVDVATEMAVMTRNQVLSQAGVAMLAQANAMPQMALTLLR